MVLLCIDLCHHRLLWDEKRWVRMLLFGGFLQLLIQISKKNFPVSWTTKVDQLTMEPGMIQGYIMFSNSPWFNSFSCIFLVSDCIIYTVPLWRWTCLRVAEFLVETGSILLHVMSLISFNLLIKNFFSCFYSRLLIIFPFGCDIHGLLVVLKSLPTLSFLKSFQT